MRRTIIVMIACALAAALGCRYQRDVAREAPPTPPSTKSCEKCHAEVYAEWEDSPHAHALSPRFTVLTNGAKISRCNACHIPTSAVPGSPPPMERYYQRDTGVNCVTCHYWKGMYLGPYGKRRAPHPVLKMTGLYEKSEFCGTCHRGAFEEWNAAPALAKARQCQQCHLPRVTRKVERRTLVSFSRRIYQARSHNAGLYAVAGFPDAVRLTVLRGDRLTSAPSIIVRVENRLPHSIPTGDYGYRKGVMQVTLVRDDGTTVPAAREQTFFRSLGTALPSLKEKQFDFTFAADAPTTPSAVAVTLYRVSAEGANKITIAEQNIPFSEIKRKSETLKTKK
jgi:nitrate/TMAO reductase-like tetraheme cytochrome c subunit